MNKKLKIAIPFAVLTLTCGISAGAFAGCKTHVHNYSDWKIEGNEHVRVCPDDGVTDESTRGPHEFFGGECECGAKENADKKYGTASGQIKLHKLGSYVNDYTGITIDMGDDDVIASVDPATGKFKIENIVAGKNYNLKISKDGYKDYPTVVNVEAGKDTVIGGKTGAVLEYDAFGLLCDYDGNYHDFSHVNDENPVFKFLENDGSKTLNVLSRDKYSEVSASLHLDYSNSVNNMRTQGIVLKFEDGKHVIIRYHNGDQVNGNIQYAGGLWTLDKSDSLFDMSKTEEWAWDEHKLRDLTSAETKAIKADGIDLTVMLKNGVIHTFLGGAYIESYTLPEGYAEKKAQVGYFVFNTVSNASVSYNITESVPEMESRLNINVTRPEDGTVCSVTAAPDKDTYELTESVELTFNAPEGYRLEALTVAGEDRYGDVVDGKLTIVTNRINLDVDAVFAKEKEISIDVLVKGLKLGTTANLAQGTTVTFKNTAHAFEVDANGKITGSVMAGRYTVVVDGYFEKTVTIDESTTEIVLEYNTFKQLLGWGNFDFDKQNDTTTELGFDNDCAVFLTNDTYSGRVMASIYLKGNNMTAGNGGLVFRFVGAGLNAKGETVTVVMQNTTKVQVAEDGLWGNTTVAEGCTWNNVLYFKDCYDDGKDRVADANAKEYLDAYAKGELKLSVLREGADFYLFLNGRFIGKHTVNAKYADASCEVGFVVSNLQDNSSWKSFKAEIDTVSQRQTAALTNGTAAGAHGTVTLPAEEHKVGDSAVITVTPENGYIIKKLTVGGRDVTSLLQINQETRVGTCSAMLYGDSAVVAEFEQVTYSSIQSSVSMKKLGQVSALTDGTEVTLSNKNFRYTVAVSGGKIDISQIAAGVYTVGTEKCIDVTVTIGADKYEEAIVFEYLTFTSWVGYDNNLHDYSHVNDAQPTIGVNGNGSKSLDIISTDTYDDVALTIKAKSANAGVIQGIVLKFEDGKCAVFNIKTDQKLVQFRGETVWGQEPVFVNGEGNGEWKESEAGSVTQEDIDKFNGDGVDVKLVRKGGMMYAYVDGRQVYSVALPAGYEDDKIQVGFFAMDVKANAVWEIGVSTTLPDDLA